MVLRRENSSRVGPIKPRIKRYPPSTPLIALLMAKIVLRVLYLWKLRSKECMCLKISTEREVRVSCKPLMSMF